MTDQLSDYRRIVDSFDADEGYPTDEWIDAFGALPQMAFTYREAARFLVNDLPNIAMRISCMSIFIDAGADRPAVSVAYHTGGWSGAEDLIRVMLRQFWIHRLHCKWERGGHFYFEVPNTLLVDHQSDGEASKVDSPAGADGPQHTEMEAGR